MSNVVVKSPMQYLDKATGTLARPGPHARQGRGRADQRPPAKNLRPRSGPDRRHRAHARAGRRLQRGGARADASGRDRRALPADRRRRSTRSATTPRRWSTSSPTRKIDLWERVTNVWMKISRGDIADRFDRIKQTYLDVTRSTKDQIERETVILDAYRDFRGALKQAEVMALEVLRTAEQKLNAAQGGAGGRVQGRVGLPGHGAGRARPVRADPRRAPAPHPGRGEALPDRQGPLGQPDGELQHLGGHHGAPAADHERQGARLRAGGDLLLHQRLRADRAQGVVHRHVRPARVDADPERDEGGRVAQPRGAGRDRRPGRRGGRARPATAPRSAPTR